MTEVKYSNAIHNGETVGIRADLVLTGGEKIGNYAFSAVGAGVTKEDAQIELHNQLQNIYEEIGNHIEYLRGVIQ